MSKAYQQHGYLAFKALSNTAYELVRTGKHDAAAKEIETMALRLREILYAVGELEELKLPDPPSGSLP